MVFKRLRDEIYYPATEVVIDRDPRLLRTIQEIFPGIPIQLYIKHLHSDHMYYLKYQFQGSKEVIEHISQHHS